MWEHVAVWTPAFAGVTDGGCDVHDLICLMIVMPAKGGASSVRLGLLDPGYVAQSKADQKEEDKSEDTFTCTNFIKCCHTIGGC